MSGNVLLPASLPSLTLSERLQLGLAAQHVLSWGCGGRDGLGPGVGWQSWSSQVRQELLAAPHVSHASLHFPSAPPAVGGPSRPPGSTVTCPSAPCHLLKISPTRSGSFSVLMSVYPKPLLSISPLHALCPRRVTLSHSRVSQQPLPPALPPAVSPPHGSQRVPQNQKASVAPRASQRVSLLLSLVFKALCVGVHG